MSQLRNKLEPWFEARKRFKLSHADIQMARELGTFEAYGKMAESVQRRLGPIYFTELDEFLERLRQRPVALEVGSSPRDERLAAQCSSAHARVGVGLDGEVRAHAGKGRADELWRTTCFELFLRPDGGRGYVELNLSPSERWARSTSSA